MRKKLKDIFDCFMVILAVYLAWLFVQTDFSKSMLDNPFFYPEKAKIRAMQRQADALEEANRLNRMKQ